MKKILIFILSLLVMITMTLSFVSCSKDNDNQGETGSDTGNTNTDTSDGTDDGVDTDTNDGTSTDTSNGEDNKTDDGTEDVVCKHESTNNCLIKFSDYGAACGGGIYLEKCQSCNKILDGEETLVTFCTYENDSSKCTSCGLEISKTVSQNGCEITEAYSATLGETKIFEGLTVTSIEHDLKIEITKLNKDDCTVTIATEKCKTCDLTNLRSTLHEGNELNVTNEEQNEESIKTSSCNACGYKEIRKFSEVADCTDTKTRHIELSLYDGESLLYSGKNGSAESHNFKTTFVKYGDECRSGIVTIKECETCAHKEYETTQDHVTADEKIALNFDSCSENMTVKKCLACDQILEITEKPEGCYFKETKNEYVNNGLEISYECVDCGLIMEIMSSDDEFTACARKASKVAKLLKDGEEVFLVKNEYVYDSHYDSHYEFTYEKLGNSCLDGIIKIGVCKNCGDTVRIVETNVREHKIISSEKIGIDTPCGSEVQVTKCVCGQVEDMYSYEGCEFHTTGEDSVEIDGIRFSVTTKTCFDCEAVRVHKYASVDKDCQVQYYDQITYTLKSGETVYDSGMCATYIVPRHKIERKYMALGPSCQIDGIVCAELCKNCDYYRYDIYNDHYKNDAGIIDISEYGVCSGHITTEKCPCDEGLMYGEYIDYECDLKETFSEDENERLLKLECAECGYIMEDKTEYIYQNCQKITNETTTFSINGEVIFEYKPKHEPEEYHQLETTFRLLADNCEEGLYETGECKDCDYKKVTAYYRCVIKDEIQFSFRDYGVCDGAYYFYDCYCGNMYQKNYTLFCELEETFTNTETIDGVSYKTTTYTCKNCGVQEIIVKHNGTEGCNEYEYSNYNVVMGEKVLVEDSLKRSFVRSYHEDEISFELLGEKCTDGFKEISTCTKCGQVSPTYYYDHYLYEKYHFSGGNECVHSVTYFECPCTESQKLSVESLEETENGYGCDLCGVKVIINTVITNENCKETTKITKQVYIGSELQVEYVNVSAHDAHSFDAPVLSNQDGKDIITSKCKDCEYELVQEIYVLVYEEGDWGVEGQTSFTVSKDGEYTLYASSVDARENTIYSENGNYLAGFYSNGVDYPVGTAQLEKDESYRLEVVDYSYRLSFSAFVLIEGQYSMCMKAENTVKLTTSDGKYELTLCEKCHMIIDVQEVTQ